MILLTSFAIYKDDVIIYLKSGRSKKELILDNHSEVMYDYDLIPKDEIRNYETVAANS